MKKVLYGFVALILAGLIALCFVLYFGYGPKLNPKQIETVKILAIVCGASAIYCFVVGEITRNNSQMDKLWSILPEVYVWIVAIKGGLSLRLIVMAVLATLWGIRLTFNFARKGAYSIKFWTGVEDYRWVILREKKMFKPRYKWALFNFFFISIYQNALVLLITFPALFSMSSTTPFGLLDGLATALTLGFLILETIADEQQWAFQSTKHKLLKEGKSLNELPAPYNKGFNTTGLWAYARHPNYLGEQGIWFSFYIFSIGASVTGILAGVLNWSMFGAVMLITLFLGSSTMGEKISSSKYPEYKNYINSVPRYFPVKKYKG